MSALVPNEVSRPFGLRSKRWLLIRHLLTSAVTVLVVMVIVLVVTVPFVAVFVIDRGRARASGNAPVMKT